MGKSVTLSEISKQVKDVNQSVFEVLSAINVQEHVEKKNGLSYLSWAWAWSYVKNLYPNANYIIYETPEGVNYFTDGKTCWVKTGVIIEGLEHIEYLPVMDYKNKSIPYEKVTSFDVNKAIQRSLTKALARHGLGLYIYAGEDLPENETIQSKEVNSKPADPTIMDLTILWGKQRKRMEELGINYRSPALSNWFIKATGSDNQEATEDIAHMKKLTTAYQALIDNKEKTL